jgi:hypothetical protein
LSLEVSKAAQNSEIETRSAGFVLQLEERSHGLTVDASAEQLGVSRRAKVVFRLAGQNGGDQRPPTEISQLPLGTVMDSSALASMAA